MAQSTEDKSIKELLELGSGHFPFPDFEDEVMAEIIAFEKRRKSIRRNLKFAWLFFGLGLLTGIILMTMLPNWLKAGPDILSQFLYSLIIIGCILLFLVQGDRLRQLGGKYR